MKTSKYTWRNHDEQWRRLSQTSSDIARGVYTAITQRFSTLVEGRQHPSDRPTLEPDAEFELSMRSKLAEGQIHPVSFLYILRSLSDRADWIVRADWWADRLVACDRGTPNERHAGAFNETCEIIGDSVLARLGHSLDDDVRVGGKPADQDIWVARARNRGLDVSGIGKAGEVSP